MKIKADELDIHVDIREAFAVEISRIDEEINELRQARRELRKILGRVRTVGRRAYLAMNDPNGHPKHSACYGPAARLCDRVRDLRGYHSRFYTALSDRQFDLWVSLGGLADLSGVTMPMRSA